MVDVTRSDDDVDGETALISCVLSKSDEGWHVKNVGEFSTEFAHGITAVNGMVSVAASHCVSAKAAA